jgi:hypothetical protein
MMEASRSLIIPVVNLGKPSSDLSAASVDSKSGQVIDPGEFGRIHSVNNNARLIQLAVKFNY